MKKSIIAAGLATVLAATTFAGSAMAGPYYWYGSGPHYWSMYHPRPVYYYHYRHYPHYYPYYPGYYSYYYDPGPAIVAGAIFGMIGAALAHQHHHH